jgi:hypothetical protein
MSQNHALLYHHIVIYGSYLLGQMVMCYGTQPITITLCI